MNQRYLQENDLNVELFGRGFAWLDTGSYDNLLSASNFVQIIEKRQGFKIACIEEIALRNNWITSENIKKIAQKFSNNEYGLYLHKLIED